MISGSAACAEILALKGANVNITDTRGQLPIGVAAEQGMLDIVEVKSRIVHLPLAYEYYFSKVLLRFGGGGSDFTNLLDDQKKQVLVGKKAKRKGRDTPLSQASLPAPANTLDKEAVLK